MTTLVLAGNDFVIDEKKHKEARQILNKTRDIRVLKFSIDLEDGAQLAVPAGLSKVIEGMIQVAANGGKMTFTTLPNEMTTAAAASMLGVSRPTLMKFIREGKIKAHKVGSHSRVLASDLLKFQEERHAQQTAAFHELRELTADLVEN
jgi:excisionase family DNA binding protein